LGAVASESAHQQDWFRQRIVELVTQLGLGWDGFKTCMEQFLWWDYIFDDRVNDIWDDVWGLRDGADLSSSPDLKGSSLLQFEVSHRISDEAVSRCTYGSNRPKRSPVISTPNVPRLSNFHFSMADLLTGDTRLLICHEPSKALGHER
jgi:hypothetical protein